MKAPKITQVLSECLSSEEQAIAIYEAECWFLRRSAFTRGRKTTLALCEKILAEEREHRSGIVDHLEPRLALSAVVMLSKLGGYALGAALAQFPSRLNWRVHVWAEIQAAKIYRNAANLIASDPSSENILNNRAILKILREAERQELEHSRLFQNE